MSRGTRVVPQKFLAFDLEYDRPLPPSWSRETSPDQRRENESDINIIAAACSMFDGLKTAARTFRSLAPLPMDVAKVEQLARFLVDKDEEGYVIVTWGGTASDFRLLASKVQDQDLKKRIVDCCLEHVDIPLAIMAQNGMMVGLEAVAKACLPDKKNGKTETSKEIAEAWRQGGQSSLQVIRHVADDALTTARLYGTIMASPNTPFDQRNFPKAVRARHSIPRGSGWTIWENKKGDACIACKLDVTACLGKDMTTHRLRTVWECKAYAQTRVFPWETMPPFSVDSCTAWL